MDRRYYDYIIFSCSIFYQHHNFLCFSGIFGSKIQIQYKDGSSGPVREIQSGSGYWSQNSPVQIMGYNKPVSSIKIQWPDGSNSSESFNKEKVIIKYTGD